MSEHFGTPDIFYANQASLTTTTRQAAWKTKLWPNDKYLHKVSKSSSKLGRFMGGLFSKKIGNISKKCIMLHTKKFYYSVIKSYIKNGDSLTILILISH